MTTIRVDEDGQLDDLTIEFGDGNSGTISGEHLLKIVKDIDKPHALLMVVSSSDISQRQTLHALVSRFPNARMAESVVDIAGFFDSLYAGTSDEAAIALNRLKRRREELPEAVPVPRLLAIEGDD